MREVLKFNENHITGKRVERECLKPDNGISGVGTILLFRDGKEIEKTVSHNIIPNPFNEREWYRILYQSILNGFKVTPFDTGSYINQTDSFKNLILSTSTEMEDEKNIFHNGTIVGWCPDKDTNPGSDTTRGSYNATESYVEVKEGYYHAHKVFDFSTSQANGNIESIFWSRGVNSSNIKIPEFTTVNFNPINNVNSKSKTFKYPVFDSAFDNEYWVKCNPSGGSGEGYYKLKNADECVQGLLDFDDNINLESFKSNVLQVPTYKCRYAENAVIVEENSTTSNVSYCNLSIVNNLGEKIKSVKIDFYADETISKYMREAGSWGRLSVSGIREVTSTGDVSMLLYGWADINSSSYDKYPSYNIDSDSLESKKLRGSYCFAIYNIETESWTLKPDWDNVMCRRNTTKRCVDMFGRYIIKNRIFITSMNEDTVDSICEEIEVKGKEYCWQYKNHKYADISNSSYANTWSKNNYTTAKIHGENTIFMTYMISPHMTNAGFGYQFTFMELIPGYSAHTKLPTPVVKTSADTMKVIYDYYIQIPRIFNSNGNLLEPVKI